MKAQIPIAALAGFALACAGQAPREASPADLAFLGGAIYTVDAEQSWTEAVAIRGGVIVAVGSEAEVRPLIDEACEEVGRDPATLARTFSVLITGDNSIPYWEAFMSDDAIKALKPLKGAPADIAESLRAFVVEGASHIQIHLDPSTPQAIQKLAPVLEAFDSS